MRNALLPSSWHAAAATTTPWSTWRKCCRAKATPISISSPCRPPKPTRTPATACRRASIACCRNTRTMASWYSARPCFCSRTVIPRRHWICWKRIRPRKARSPRCCCARACCKAWAAAKKPCRCCRKPSARTRTTSVCASPMPAPWWNRIAWTTPKSSLPACSSNTRMTTSCGTPWP
ncbi:hypothetical protein D3C79_798910 [compost metagenome]